MKIVNREHRFDNNVSNNDGMDMREREKCDFFPSACHATEEKKMSYGFAVYRFMLYIPNIEQCTYLFNKSI